MRLLTGQRRSTRHGHTRRRQWAAYTNDSTGAVDSEPAFQAQICIYDKRQSGETVTQTLPQRTLQTSALYSAIQESAHWHCAIQMSAHWYTGGQISAHWHSTNVAIFKEVPIFFRYIILMYRVGTMSVHCNNVPTKYRPTGTMTEKYRHCTATAL